MAYKIVVDSGHGGEDPGAVYPGRQEKEDTLRLRETSGGRRTGCGVYKNHGCLPDTL